MQAKHNNEISGLLEKNKFIFPYMFWDNVTSINNLGKTPSKIEQEEPGYFSSLSVALLNALSDERFEKDLSIGEVKQLHYDCTSFTKNLSKDNMPGEMKGKEQGYAYENPKLFSKKNFLKSLLDDALLFKEIKDKKGDFNFSITVQFFDISEGTFSENIIDEDRITSRIKSHIEESKEDQLNIWAIDFENAEENTVKLEGIVCEFISSYHDELKLASSNEDKIRAILKLVRPLQRLHAFPDANGRVWFMLAVNRELVKHGMLPTIPDNPNDIDMCSIDDSVELIKKGQKRFEDVVIKNTIAIKDVVYNDIVNETSSPLAKEWHEQAKSISSAIDFLHPEKLGKSSRFLCEEVIANYKSQKAAGTGENVKEAPPFHSPFKK